MICFSHQKKRMKQVEKLKRSGMLDVDSENPFDLFLSSTSIRHVKYTDTHKVLGNTYGMCVLQVSSVGGRCREETRNTIEWHENETILVAQQKCMFFRSKVRL